MLKVKCLSYKYLNNVILDDVNIDFLGNRLYTIVGQSGVGKSTFLSLISGLEYLQKGELFFKEEKIKNFTKYRREISFIFQSYNLISHLSIIDNIRLATDIHNTKITKNEIETILNKLNLGSLDPQKKCSELSGGQQQRVAIARALAIDSELIIADEPTGNLDQKTGEDIISVFQELRELGKCVIIVTHDKKIEKVADEILTIKNRHLIPFSH